jgi:Fe-S-cluster containining protein
MTATAPRRATLRLHVLGQELTASFDVPAEPMRPHGALAAAHAITDAIVGVASAASAAAGRPISCRAGCAACCRQLVTLAPVEAAGIADQVESLPADTQAQVRARFEGAIRRMRAGGLVEPGSPDHAPVLRAPAAKRAEDAFNALLDAYFALKIDCPFLENEACTIYEQRPSICREYVITSPPENCSHVGTKPTEGVKLPVYLSDRLVGFGEAPDARPTKLPLPFALAWSARHGPDLQGPTDPKTLLTELVARVHRK